MAEIFKGSKDCAVDPEADPKLLEEARLCFEGKLEDLRPVAEKKRAAIEKSSSSGKTYVDKNPSFIWFAQQMVSVFNTRVVFVVRDGRDTVRSMIDWNQYHSRSMYCLPEDWDEGSAEVAAIGRRSLWDRSRPRPKKGEALYKDWKFLDRFAKCSWYWNYFNLVAKDLSIRIGAGNWHTVRMEDLDFSRVGQIFEFLKLDAPSSEHVEAVLNRKVNSAEERFKVSSRFPSHDQWSEERRKVFSRFADEAMFAYGYRGESGSFSKFHE